MFSGEEGGIKSGRGKKEREIFNTPPTKNINIPISKTKTIFFRFCIVDQGNPINIYVI
jgi:hypothetical protein